MKKEEMNIQITSDNIEVTPSMKALADKKISKIIEKIGEGTPEDLVDLRVVLNKGDKEGTFESKILLQIGGFKIVGSGDEYTLESSLIEAVEDALRRFKRKKQQEKDSWKERREMKAFPSEQSDII